MDAGRPAGAKRLHQSLEHAASVAEALRARQQVDVEVRRVLVVRRRTEIVRVVIAVMDLLGWRPPPRVAQRRGKAGAQIGTPLGVVPRVEGAGVSRAERVSADAVCVLEDEAERGFEREVRADEETPERVGIVVVERCGVLTVVAGFQTHVVRAGRIAGSCEADAAVVGRVRGGDGHQRVLNAQG